MVPSNSVQWFGSGGPNYTSSFKDMISIVSKQVKCQHSKVCFYAKKNLRSESRPIKDADSEYPGRVHQLI